MSRWVERSIITALATIATAIANGLGASQGASHVQSQVDPTFQYLVNQLATEKAGRLQCEAGQP